VLAWLFVWSDVQICIWPSWYHCHSLSLASVKSRSVLPFWYRLTWVVPDKGPLNVCVCVCYRIASPHKAEQFSGLLPKDADNNPAVVLLPSWCEQEWCKVSVRWSRWTPSHTLWQRAERLQELSLPFHICQQWKSQGLSPVELNKKLCYTTDHALCQSKYRQL